VSGYKQPLSVLVLIHAADQILLLERARHPGYWQSVTGSREGEESLLDTACREVVEETGIACLPEQLRDWHVTNRFEILPLWRERYAPDVTHNHEHVFSLALPAVQAIAPNPQEHRAWRWLPRIEAAPACFSWSNRDAILMLDRDPSAT
jgi:dATP pyrophosphohydrolase